MDDNWVDGWMWVGGCYRALSLRRVDRQLAMHYMGGKDGMALRVPYRRHRGQQQQQQPAPSAPHHTHTHARARANEIFGFVCSADR